MSSYGEPDLIVDLTLVTTPGEIRDNVSRFCRDAAINEQRAEKILRQTTYWVYDPDSDCFGPAKFVGYRSMTWPRYEAATAGHSSGAVFDGGVTHQALTSVLGEFRTEESLVNRLRGWGTSLISADVFGGADASKWRFARLAESRSYWSLLCDPECFMGLKAVEALDELTWTVDRGEPKVGDRVLLWQAKGIGERARCHRTW